MNAHAPIAAAFSTDAPGWDRPVFERQIAMLGELAEAGLEAALSIRDQAVAAAADGAPAASPRVDFGLAYARAAKAVRMTLALQRRYILDLQFQDRFGQPAPAVPASAQAPASPVDRVRHGLATGDIGEADAVERLELMLDAADALDEYEDLRDDIPDLPLDDLVAKICKDLGLPANWRERAQARIESGAVERPPAERGDPIGLDERDGFGVNAPPFAAKAQRRGVSSDFPEPPG